MRVIAGKARRLQLKTVRGDAIRPTTDRIKETLFNILREELFGCTFLDLFSGSGAIGIEALSRGASLSVFVEQNKEALRCIRENLKSTQLEENARILPMDAREGLRILNKEGKSFDLIFLDPPYNCLLEKEVLSFLSGSRLIKDRSTIVVEASIDTDFTYVDELGFTVLQVKRYKTNQHVILSCSEGRN